MDVVWSQDSIISCSIVYLLFDTLCHNLLSVAKIFHNIYASSEVHIEVSGIRHAMLNFTRQNMAIPTCLSDSAGLFLASWFKKKMS